MAFLKTFIYPGFVECAHIEWMEPQTQENPT